MRGVGVGALIGSHEGFEAGHDTGHDTVADFDLGARGSCCAVVCGVIGVELVVEVVKSETNDGDDAGKGLGLVGNMWVGRG